MRFFQLSAALLLVTGSVACAAKPVETGIPLTGTSSDIEKLTGDWAGTYEAKAASRSGTVSFKLNTQQDTARGTILMTVHVTRPPNVPGAYPQPYTRMQPVGITFIKATGGFVSGELEPYRDPVTNENLRTTFVGVIQGDRIKGTFTINNLDTRRNLTGEWLAFRQ